jgi:hypothetical protein
MRTHQGGHDVTTRLFLGIPFCLYIFLGYRWIKMGIACLPLAGESWMPPDWRLLTPAQSVTGTKPNKPLEGPDLAPSRLEGQQSGACKSPCGSAAPATQNA